MPQRNKTIYASILSKEPPVAPTSEEAGDTDLEAPRTARKPVKAATPSKKEKVVTNKATDPGYLKLTAYIPRSLHWEMKAAMVEDQQTDQSVYIEELIREKLSQRQSATVSKRSRATG